MNRATDAKLSERSMSGYSDEEIAAWRHYSKTGEGTTWEMRHTFLTVAIHWLATLDQRTRAINNLRQVVVSARESAASVDQVLERAEKAEARLAEVERRCEKYVHQLAEPMPTQEAIANALDDLPCWCGLNRRAQRQDRRIA